MRRIHKLALAWGIVGAIISATCVADNNEQHRIDEIKVIGITPVQSGGLDADKIAANVQSATSSDLEEQHSLDLSEFLNRNLASVFINHAQNNPLQPDVQFRGFVASPLLGLPQALSVYQDGVRINEPFGDTVNWALIPESAILSVDLVPGSNPLFGLNTLGGALSVRTKSGFSHPGSQIDVSAGSFGRTNASVETGAAFNDELAYFATVVYFGEDGWRDFSPSDALQFFGNLSAAGDVGSIDLSVNLVQTELIGNGPAPVDLLSADRKAIFTRPDITENDLLMLNLRGNLRLSDRWSLDGNVYVRQSDVSALNGDDSEFEECSDSANTGFICEQDGSEQEIVVDESGSPIRADASLVGATVNRSITEQDGLGGTLQVAVDSRQDQRGNQFIIGINFDRGDIDFRASTELGALDATRLAVSGGVFAGEAFTNLGAEVDHYGVYFTNTWSLNQDAAVTVSGRYNRSEVVLNDRLGTALSGNHEFDRFNPAAGITYRISPTLGFYIGYSESNRIPTPVELTCADENDPCRLPNAFLADPPLQQVVGKSWDAGVRGEFGPVDWHFGLFRTSSEDDIIFVSAGRLTNQGFFDNVGRTLRRGFEANVRGEAFKKLDWSLNYTYLEATFEENIALSSANNPAAVSGEVFVRPGDRLPLVPEGLLKVGLNYDVSTKLNLDASLLYSEKIFMRGDEGNDVAPISSYTVVGLRGTYRLNQHMSWYATIDNVFDKHYETFGLFGEPEEVLGEGFDDPRFLGPGSPRAAWIGLQLTF